MLIPLTALLVAALAPSLSGRAEEPVAVAPLQDSAPSSTQPPANTAPSNTVPTGADADVPPSTVVADNPFGLPSVDPIDGGRPIPDASVEAVHRWTITPEGANDPDAASSRSSLSYVGDRDSVITDGVTVFNLGNEVLTFHVYPTDAVNGTDGEFSFLPFDEPSTGLGSWVTVAQEYVTLEPGMVATIPITITIPDDASPGDHVGGVMASTSTAAATDDGTVIGLDRGVGTRLFVRVAGPLRPELAVEGLAVDHDGPANPLQGASDVSFQIRNRGNVRLSGTYQLTVAGPFGIAQQVGQEIVFPEVLPGQSIPVTTRVEDIPTLGWVSAEVALTASGSDGAAASDKVSATALALPIVLILLVLLVVLFLLTARRIRRHRLAESGSVPAEPADVAVIEHQLT
jgi:hypothetical protein